MSRSGALGASAALASAALASAALALAACAPPDRPLTTHVEDWRDEVIYQVVTDRFANGDPSNDGASGVEPVPGDFSRIQGGDWRGLEERLDYVEDLGATVIWISPIVRNVPRMEVGDGYHGYWAADLTELEPRFGSEAELRSLVDAAHDRGMLVMVDVVTNHLGRVFSYDLDQDSVEDEGEAQPPYQISPYPTDAVRFYGAAPQLFSPVEASNEGVADSELAPARISLEARHFHLRGVGDLAIPEQRRFGDFPDGLRDLEDGDEMVRLMAQTWVTWAARTNVDGFRIDAVPHVSEAFWPAFCRQVRRRLRAMGKDRFFLLGEIFETDARNIVPYVGLDALDAGFDLPLKYDLVNGVVLDGGAPSEALTALESARRYFRDQPQEDGIGLSPWQARVSLIDNHDTGRLRSEIDDPFAIDQALVAIFTVDAIPSVYYGTEQELASPGGHGSREPLWLTGYRRDLPTFRLIQVLTALRRSSPALRRGTLEVRFASTNPSRGIDGLPTVGEPDAGLLAWERTLGDEHVLVVLNTHPAQSSSATFEASLPAGDYLDALEGEASLAVDASGTVSVEVPPRRSRVFVRARR